MNPLRALPLVFLSAVSMLVSACVLDTGLVDITVQGNGRVASNPQGISCTSAGGDCNAQLGSSYVLYAEPANGSHLDHWDGDELCTARGQAAVVVGVPPQREVKCTAVFVDDATQTTP